MQAQAASACRQVAQWRAPGFGAGRRYRSPPSSAAPAHIQAAAGGGGALQQLLVSSFVAPRPSLPAPQCSTAIKGCVQCQSGRRGAKCTMCRGAAAQQGQVWAVVVGQGAGCALASAAKRVQRRSSCMRMRPAMRGVAAPQRRPDSAQASPTLPATPQVCSWHATLSDSAGQPLRAPAATATARCTALFQPSSPPAPCAQLARGSNCGKTAASAAATATACCAR